MQVGEGLLSTPTGDALLTKRLSQNKLPPLKSLLASKSCSLLHRCPVLLDGARLLKRTPAVVRQRATRSRVLRIFRACASMARKEG